MNGDAGVTTHVLDTSIGRPAAGVTVRLEVQGMGGWRLVNERVTDADGRIEDLVPEEEGLEAAVYRLIFDTDAYFERRGVAGFYPRVSIDFEITEPSEHHHVPLLLSPFGYSTYRGS